MKSRFLISTVLLLLTGILILIGISNRTPHVKIESDIENFTHTLSSVRGFSLTAKMTPPPDEDYVYHWSADSGSFITAVHSLENPITSHISEDSKALWTPEIALSDKTSYEVTVVVKNSQGVEMARDSIEFIYEGTFYSLKK